MKVTGAIPRLCRDCGTSHIGLNPCGMSYRDRLQSQVIDRMWGPSYEKRNYFDQQSLDETFGEHAKDTLMEETKGVGAVSAEEMRRYKNWSQEIAEYYSHGEEVPLDD